MENSKIQLVNFLINGQLYGINIKDVQIIERVKLITKVPKASPAVRGVLNLRGEIIPVLNVREQLNFPEKEDSENTRVVIVLIDDEKTGIIVDEVKEVVEIQANDIEATPSAQGSANTSHIVGIAKTNGKIVSILNIKNLIEDAFAL